MGNSNAQRLTDPNLEGYVAEQVASRSIHPIVDMKEHQDKILEMVMEASSKEEVLQTLKTVCTETLTNIYKAEADPNNHFATAISMQGKSIELQLALLIELSSKMGVKQSLTRNATVKDKKTIRKLCKAFTEAVYTVYNGSVFALSKSPIQMTVATAYGVRPVLAYYTCMYPAKQFSKLNIYKGVISSLPCMYFFGNYLFMGTQLIEDIDNYINGSNLKNDPIAHAKLAGTYMSLVNFTKEHIIPTFPIRSDLNMTWNAFASSCAMINRSRRRGISGTAKAIWDYSANFRKLVISSAVWLRQLFTDISEYVGEKITEVKEVVERTASKVLGYGTKKALKLLYWITGTTKQIETEYAEDVKQLTQFEEENPVPAIDEINTTGERGIETAIEAKNLPTPYIRGLIE